MKKALKIFLAATFILALCGCRGSSGKTPQPDDPQPANDKYLTQQKLQEYADADFVSFARNYDKEHSDGFVDVYLPKCLEARQAGDHQYEFYYFYCHGYGSIAEADVRVIKITAIAMADGTYSLSRDASVRYPVYLTNIHQNTMNVRDIPATTGYKVDKIEQGQKFEIYTVNYMDYLYENDKYIWYNLDASGYTRWVADGARTSNDYYRFDNGSSTRELVLNF